MKTIIPTQEINNITSVTNEISNIKKDLQDLKTEILNTVTKSSDDINNNLIHGISKSIEANGNIQSKIAQSSTGAIIGAISRSSNATDINTNVEVEKFNRRNTKDF